MDRENAIRVPPAHPGGFMKRWLMDRRNLDPADLARQTELTEPTISGIMAGIVPIDKQIATKLSKVFGETAETLYRMQYELDYFQTHGTLPLYEQLPILEMPTAQVSFDVINREKDRVMAISMYHASVPVFLQLLGGLKGVIEKAEAHATAHKWEENTVLNLRLYPDMFTLARQVRQASEHAFGAGRAAGVAVPELPAIDNSWAEVKSRIDKTIDFLKGLRADELDGREDQQVTITQGGQPRNFRAQVYLYHLAMPNFYFHTTTAYNIIRSLGVEIGKRDFMGQMPS